MNVGDRPYAVENATVEKQLLNTWMVTLTLTLTPSLTLTLTPSLTLTLILTPSLTLTRILTLTLTLRWASLSSSCRCSNTTKYSYVSGRHSNLGPANASAEMRG